MTSPEGPDSACDFIGRVFGERRGEKGLEARRRVGRGVEYECLSGIAETQIHATLRPVGCDRRVAHWAETLPASKPSASLLCSSPTQPAALDVSPSCTAARCNGGGPEAVYVLRFRRLRLSRCATFSGVCVCVVHRRVREFRTPRSACLLEQTREMPLAQSTWVSDFPNTRVSQNVSGTVGQATGAEVYCRHDLVSAPQAHAPALPDDESVFPPA